MKTFSAEESLWLSLPIFIVLIGLVAGILVLNNSSTDIRSKASEPAKPLITPKPTNNTQDTKPEVVCSEIYDPVCGSDGKTYSNSCEAVSQGMLQNTPGICPTPTAVSLPVVNE